jgi:pentatricopeptide repeat protein
MFDQMKSEAVMPDEVTFLSILEAVQGLLTEGKRIDAMITSSRFRSQDAIVTALISMYGECGSLGAVQRLFDGLPEKNNAAWNVLISLHVQQGQGFDALQMFDEMLQIGVIPSHVTHISCLRACTSLCVLGKGKHVYTQMIHSESGPNTLIDTALVNLYSRCGKLVDARRVFDGISEHDVVSFNAMIAAYARHGHHKAVVEIFYGMLNERLVPDSLTFVHALSACSHAGLIDDGKHIFRLMRTKYGMNPGLEHYDCMIDALSRAGCLEEVNELIITMPFKPSMISWTCALSSCSDVNMGNKVAHSMLEIDPMCYSPYVTLSNLYTNGSEEKVKLWTRAKSLERKSFRLMSNTRVKGTSLHAPTNVHQTRAGAACSEFLARQVNEPSMSSICLNVKEIDEDLFVYDSFLAIKPIKNAHMFFPFLLCTGSVVSRSHLQRFFFAEGSRLGS